MLRITILAVFTLVVKTQVFSQVLNLLDFVEPEHISNGSTYDRINYNTPRWADTFADSTIKKLLVPSKKSSTSIPSTLPSGVRPVDYIGRDGLPGDPLPAVHMEPFPRTITWRDKLKDIEVQDSVLIERIRLLFPPEK